MAAIDEYLDLVDDHDRVIGKMSRTEIYQRNLSNYRVVNALILNDLGQLWIPRRTAHKRIFPLALDMSMGGHVSSGESYEEAFERETKEEWDETPKEYRILGKMTPAAHGTSSFMTVYEIVSNEAPVYNPDDFIEAFWLYPQEIMDLITQGEKTKEDLPRIIKHFYLKKKNKGNLTQKKTPLLRS